MAIVPDSSRRSPPNPPGGKGPLWLWLLGGAVAAGVLLFVLFTSFPEAVSSDSSQISLIWGVTLLVVLGGSLTVHIRARPGQALRQATIWIALAAVLLLGYSYRHELETVANRMLAELLPYRGVKGDGTISLSARQGGHFVAEAVVDGVPIRFLVDTGATDVVLTPADAKKLGFNLDRLDFTRRYQTANGVVLGAPIRLGRIAVGPVVLEDVAASVNRAEIGQSLLGMSFLGRLSSYGVEGGRLTLRQ